MFTCKHCYNCVHAEDPKVNTRVEFSSIRWCNLKESEHYISDSCSKFEGKEVSDDESTST